MCIFPDETLCYQRSFISDGKVLNHVMCPTCNLSPKQASDCQILQKYFLTVNNVVWNQIILLKMALYGLVVTAVLFAGRTVIMNRRLAIVIQCLLSINAYFKYIDKIIIVHNHA